MLNFGKVITSAEALNWGFVSEVYTSGKEKGIWKQIQDLAKLPSKVCDRFNSAKSLFKTAVTICYFLGQNLSLPLLIRIVVLFFSL